MSMMRTAAATTFPTACLFASFPTERRTAAREWTGARRAATGAESRARAAGRACKSAVYSRRARYGKSQPTTLIVLPMKGSDGLTCDIGSLRQLNELARNAKADYIIHTGDFGFYDDTSLERIAEK